MLSVARLEGPGFGPVSFEVGAGRCLAIMGPSGAGKSLLLRAIADLDPNHGEVAVGGRSRAAMPGPEWRRQVVLMPAESGWWAETVGSHFADPAAAGADLTRLGFPGDVLDWSVSRLSTGERQRLALIRGLALAPAVALLDEPTAALDSDVVAAVEMLLRQRLEAGLAMIIVTHDAAQATRLADMTIAMAGGRITP